MIFQRLSARTFKEVYRDPLTIALGAVLPLSLMALFIAIGKRAPLPLFAIGRITPGIAVFGLSFLMMFAGMVISKDRQTAFLSRLLTTPLSPADFILAYLLPFLPVGLIQVSACVGLGLAFGLPWNAGILASLLVLLPVAVACSSLGILMGALLSEGQVAGVGSLLMNVIGIFSGAWMDLRAIGGFIEDFGYALPFARAIDASAALMAGASLSAVAGDLGFVWLWAAALTAAAVAAFAWRTRR